MLDLIKENIETINATAANMVTMRKTYMDFENRTEFFWDDVVPGILLSDGHFYDFHTIETDNHVVIGVITIDEFIRYFVTGDTITTVDNDTDYHKFLDKL